MSYQPSKKILANYADVLVNFALNSGRGVKKDEVVEVIVPDIAKALALELQNTLLKAAAHPLIRLLPTEFSKDFYSLANDQQLKFFPKKYLRAKVNLIDHRIGIIADPNPRELSEIDPKKIIMARDIKKPYFDWLNKKEQQGKFTWTVALWGVEAKAKEVGLSLKEYWQEIVRACFLDKADPIAKWQEVFKLQTEIKNKLNKLKIDYLEVKGPDVDLKVTLGADRIWKGGSGRNIPSFEIFTSPDWRGIEGWVRFNEPLYRYGNVLQNIYLRVEKGIIVEAKAEKGNQFLQAMLKSKNANKFGEFSLTDKRMSRIRHPMAETLFDENIAGPFGNTHLAVGMSYKDCYRGDMGKLKKKDWRAKGFNESAEHTDIISTTDRTVTAYLVDGSKKLIYKKGQFVL
ncbi:MAG: aminopeptidase [Candidatus Woesebacteria bacterium]|jgi:aminopeptidase